MNETTCGQGLAGNAALPAKLGALMAQMAEVLEIHMKALDLTDDNARKEHAAYRQLGKEQRSIAAQLQATALKMTACRNLPMARHDAKAMVGKEPVGAFKTFVGLEQELATLLQDRLEQDREMLAMMVAARSSG